MHYTIHKNVSNNSIEQSGTSMRKKTAHEMNEKLLQGWKKKNRKDRVFQLFYNFYHL